MPLRRRLILVVGLVMALLILALILASKEIVLRHSSEVEARVIEQHVQRVVDVLSLDIDFLDRITSDWATWDDAYRFVETPDEEFVKSNLVVSTFRQLGVNLIVFVNSSGQIVFAKSYDPDGDDLQPMPEGFASHLLPGSGLITHPVPTSSRSGFLVIPEMPLLVSSRPILTSAGAGPIRGTLIMAKFLDEKQVRRLSDKIHLSFTLCPWRHPHMPRELQEARAKILEGSRLIVAPSDDGTICGMTFLTDLYGRPALMLSVRTEREFHRQAMRSIQFIAGWLLFAVVVLTLTMAWLLDRHVIGGLSQAMAQLQGGIRDVTTARSPKARVREHGSEEFSQLADAINDMLQALDKAQTEAEQQRQAMIQADKMVALGTLVSGVSHEISNPNSVILLNADALQHWNENLTPFLEERYRREGDFAIGNRRYSELRDEIPKTLAGIEVGARRIASLVNDLKNFARQDPGEFAAAVDVNGVVQSALSLLQHQTRRATRKLVVRLADGPPPVRGNAQRLEQVVINLVQNSCQALSACDQGVFVTTSSDATTGCVKIEVRDEGRGIRPEDLPQITNPFFTTRRTEGGTGLGLSVTAAIVKAHGGRLEFASTLGKGTTATLVLPAAGSTPAAMG
ncbi:MAG: hypothetical protein A3K19_11375 [Lentisphaerae bacterium RIFOXYB12_FULL_65_16]|nr:MAG: hypothetical protein A3K18_25055 [Lentisphaerae bacterium RIFOXYA12_64_32]OGV90168.1 MAG: hypothetical protein A3K19_11375 [Lentisphaerae bacterium RIFOXYB12_FULL_65_16]